MSHSDIPEATLDLPMMVLTHSSTLPGPSLPARFSATTMLATTGHNCLMNLLNTSRHDAILCTTVPSALHKCEYNKSSAVNTQSSTCFIVLSCVYFLNFMNKSDIATNEFTEDPLRY